jgi:aldehyde dehydrogenase (NAD+)
MPLLEGGAGGKLVFGGKHDRSDLYIEPTILDDVKPTDLVMQSEVTEFTLL